MKIEIENPPVCAAVICKQQNCPWDRVCANHESAGDFRTEGGSRPVLRLLNGEVHCYSFDSVGNGEEHNEEPILQGKQRHIRTDPLEFNACVLWSELVEETNTYEI